jgi:hypothetical protein
MGRAGVPAHPVIAAAAPTESANDSNVRSGIGPKIPDKELTGTGR